MTTAHRHSHLHQALRIGTINLCFWRALRLAAALQLMTLAAEGMQSWTNRYDGPAGGQDYAQAVAVDANGSVYVTGSSDGVDSSGDYATIKYSNAGLPLWTNRYNGPANSDDQGRAIALDASGNVFVTGWSVGNDGGYDFATIKYSGDGAPLWTNRYDGHDHLDDFISAIAVDTNGNVYITGTSGITNDSDIVTLAYSGSGVPLWTNYYNAVARALAVDSGGNVIVTGDDVGYATIKYSGAGLPLWTNRFRPPGNLLTEAAGIAVDSSGSVFVTGWSLNNVSAYDYATVAYSNMGVPLWTNRYDGPPGDGGDYATAIAVDRSGNVFVTGYSRGNGSSFDYATIKYSNAGVPLWTNRYDGPGNDYDQAAAIAIDANGNVFVTGTATATTFLDTYATIKYSNDGVPLWTNVYGGSANALAVDASGNAFVTGKSFGDSSADYATIKYPAAAPSPIPLNWQISGNRLVLSWTNASFALQSAPTVQGAYTNIPGAFSPYTNTLLEAQRYFRLKGN